MNVVFDDRSSVLKDVSSVLSVRRSYDDDWHPHGVCSGDFHADAHSATLARIYDDSSRDHDLVHVASELSEEVTWRDDGIIGVEKDGAHRRGTQGKLAPFDVRPTQLG